MTERIQKLCELTLSGDMYVTPVAVEFDRTDLLLSDGEKDTKRISEYILAQEPKITPYSAFTGFFLFNGSVVGDAFKRGGHRFTSEAVQYFYLKSIDNLSTMEWQHATADYRKVLKCGIRGLIAEIDESLGCHDKPEEIDFLLGLKRVAEAMIAWARKCAGMVEEYAASVQDGEAKARYAKLAAALRRTPEYAPQDFYEAVLCIYVCFSADLSMGR